MASNYEYLSNVHTGRTDWKVKVRFIREWRGKTASGQPYRGYNYIVLDAKNVRMQAFVPLFLMEKLLKIFIVGRMYTITNFQVKDYTERDKWRCVSTKKQICFTNQTRAKEIDETEYFIPRNCFEFSDLADMKNLAAQSTYLADVIGVVTRRDELKMVHTKQGDDRNQVRMTISDGSTYLNVTLWGELAECFQQDFNASKYEEPLILIIAAGKVGVFQEEFDICNFSPTAYYINYNHHSVAELRKVQLWCKSGEPQFKMQQPRTIQVKKEPKLMTVQQIKQLGEDYVEEEVICQLQILTVHESNPWFYSQCTSCYKQIDDEQGVFKCGNCENRIIPYPDKKFGILFLGQDKTAKIEVLLMDRPTRKMCGKTVLQMEEETQGKFPQQFKNMENRDYTIKLQIREFNIKDKEEVYVATDIYEGHTLEPTVRVRNYSVQQATETSCTQSEANSVHLDHLAD